MINPQDSSSTRDRILEKSLEIFADLGFEGATTRKIADAAGVNVGLIKYYFDSKERLWQEAADVAFAELHASLGNTLTGLEEISTQDRLRVLARRFARFVAQHPGAVRFMQDAGTHDGPRMRWLVDRHLRPVYEILRASIVDLQNAGALPANVDPLHLFYIIVGSMTLVFHQGPECRYLSGVDPRDPAVADDHADAVIQLLSIARKEAP